VVLAGTLLASAYMFRVLAKAFGAGPRHGRAEPMAPTELGLAPVGRLAQVPALLLPLVAVVLLGLAAEPLWGLLGGDAP
jgi:hypothetical protein